MYTKFIKLDDNTEQSQTNISYIIPWELYFPQFKTGVVKVTHFFMKDLHFMFISYDGHYL